MRVTFKCKRSGNTVSFTNENDIAGLRKHEGYEEIKDGMQEEVKAPADKEVKRRGRPSNKYVI
jgi:hypothetical protein